MAKHDPHHTTVEPVWWLLMYRRPLGAWSPTTTMMTQSSQHKSRNPEVMFEYEDSQYCTFQCQEPNGTNRTIVVRHQLRPNPESSIGSQLYTHAQDTIRVIKSRRDYVMDLEFQKKSHKQIKYSLVFCICTLIH